MMAPYAVVREAKLALSPRSAASTPPKLPTPAVNPQDAPSPTSTNPTDAIPTSTNPTPTTVRRRPVKRFAPTVSPLDPADHRSGVHSSEFRGMYNLAMVTAGIYVFCSYVNNFVARGGILSDAQLLVSVFYSWHFVEVLVTFGAQVAFSYSAMLVVAMAASPSRVWSSRRTINYVHHSLQSILFFFTSVFIVYRDWNTIHAVSSFVECVVLLMKMHSYIRTKLELARRGRVAPTQSLKDFTMYLLYPTLVYEPNFPRTERIRWGYLAEKLVANTLAMCLLYIIVTDHVMPSLEDAGISNPVFVVLHLLLPFLGVYLMIWFIIFECVCNGIAEVTYMADRDFYEDWWNSTTFDEFARKWNKPVHEFLLRHVYLESLESYKLSRRSATTLTFFISALLHECVFCIVFRTVKMYFFALQMLQVVIILYGRGLKNTRLGNYIFWFGMILGLPLQAVLYCREYHGGEPIFLNLMMPVMMAGFLGVAISSVFMVGKKTTTTKPKTT